MQGIRSYGTRLIGAMSAHPLAVAFMALAVITRLVFWLYTGRVWEDAVISLSHARNVWEGVGLTHHASEPRIHGFTSALGELILIAGEGFGEGSGLVAMRLASLVAAVAAIYYAYRICLHLRLHWSAQVLLLGFLATDHLHVFFGMVGMETQVATALLLANVWYLLTQRWRRLGVAAGLAVITRPEFLLLGPVIGIALVVEWCKGHREAFVRFVPVAALVSLPWFAFATWYYGSPVPYTILVKSYTGRIVMLNTRLLNYVRDTWHNIVPFREHGAFYGYPLPDAVLVVIFAIVVVLSIVGAVAAIREHPRMLAVFALVAGFFAYRIIVRVNPYFMWYLPPFTALLFLLVACGVNWVALRQRTVAIVIGCGLFFAYAMHLPFSLPLDKRLQEDIEIDVRTKVGRKLNALMGPNDTVVLEPLGIIGWEAKNKTIYDSPGLGSPIAFAAFKKHVNMSGMVRELLPRFLVLRPHEWDDLVQRFPDTAARYESVETVRARPDLKLSLGSAVYQSGDTVFTIYRLRAG